MSGATTKTANAWLTIPAVVAISAVVGFTVYHSVPTMSSLFSSGCASGWAGFGCAIMAALASLALSAIVGGLIAFILLRAARVPNAAWLATSGAVLSGALIFGAYKNLGQGSTAAIIWMAVTVACFLLALLALRLAHNHHAWAIAAIAVVAVVFYIFGGRVAAAINTATFNNQQAGSVQSAGFAVYLPQIVPADYTLNGGMLTGQPGMPGSGPEMYTAEYYQTRNTFSQFSITSLRVPPTYMPPANCGPAQPSNAWQSHTPCQKVGVSAQGDPIYLATTKTINGDATFAAYVRIGPTLVTLAPSYGTTLTNADILTMFTSLKAYTGHSLTQLLSGHVHG